MLASVIGADEHIDRAAAAVGCTLVLTNRRLYLVRDGASFRPRTGIQSWPLDDQLEIQIGPSRRDSRRLAIVGTGRSASMFLTGDLLDAMEAFIGEVHRRANGLG